MNFNGITGPFDSIHASRNRRRLELGGNKTRSLPNKDSTDVAKTNLNEAAATSTESGKQIYYAMSSITPDPNYDNPDSNCKGDVIMTQELGEITNLKIVLSGLTPGEHAFHVHENGNITGGCTAAGGIFNPFNQPHGAPDSKVRKVGDLGNIKADAKGNVLETKTDRQTWLYSDSIKDNKTDAEKSGEAEKYNDNYIVGRSIVIHEGPDLFTGAAGNAGPRVCCGIIKALTPEEYQKNTLRLSQVEEARKPRKKANLDGINFDDGTYYSEDNIWFQSYGYKPIDINEYKRPILASNRSAIGNLKLIFQSSAIKDKFETKIVNQGPMLKNVWLNSKLGDRDGAFEDNSKYLRIKQSVVYW